MGEQKLGRRQVLGGAAAGGVAITTLGLATPAGAVEAEDDRHPDAPIGLRGLAGSWLVTRRDEGSDNDVQSVLSFAGVGVIIVHDISPAGPPFTGTFARLGGFAWKATVWTGFGGGPGGEVGPTIRVELEGHRDGDALSGRYAGTVFAPGGGPEVESFTGDFSGERIWP
jgi:hypothetical protein